MIFLSAYILFMYVCMYVCMYVWLCWVFISVRGLSLVAASGGHSSSRCAGLSLSRPLVAAHSLQTRRLSNCGSRAESLRGMWDLPRPGLEPAFSALAGRFSTTAPPGKPANKYFFLGWHSWDAFQWSFLFDRLSSAFSIPTYTKSLTLPYAGKKNGNEHKNKEQEIGIYKVPVGSFECI